MNTYDPNYISKKLFFLVGQKAVITNKAGHILLLQRSSKTRGAGKWGLAGGALEDGENPIDGIVREIEEETKLVVWDLKPFQTKVSQNKDNKNVFIICYTCKTDLDNVDLNWEHDDFKWVTPKEALKYDLTPDARTFLESFIAQ